LYVFTKQLPVGVHGSIELLALSVIGVELALKLRWIGWKTILKHKRTMIKVSLLPFLYKKKNGWIYCLHCAKQETSPFL